MYLTMASLTFTVLVLTCLTAINADSCSRLRRPDIGNILISLEEDELESWIEMVSDLLDGLEFGSLDPLYIENERYEQDDDDMNIDMNITAAAVHGLLGFEVTDFKQSLNRKRFQVDLLFPEITASGKYSLLATPPLQQFKIFGSGGFDLTAEDLRIQITGDYGKTSDGQRFIEKLESELSLESADFRVTGLLDNDLVSEIFSWGISKYAPETVSELKSDFDEFLQVYAEEVNNHLLNGEH